MSIELVVVLAVIVAALALLSSTRIAPDAILGAALVALLAVPVPGDGGWRMGVIDIKEGLSGFSNPGMLTVGVLFIVVAGLRETGGVDWIASHLLGRPKSERGALVRLIAPVWAMSTFLNNTPVVALMIPAVQSWAGKLRIAPSKLLIPLSYAAIIGGTCSLIGTSTNLVVAGLVIANTDLPPLGMFDITRVGVPAALAGAVFLVVFGPRLLPTRQQSAGTLADTREYILELAVPPGSPLIGRSVGQAGLRNLPGCFLIEIEREGEIISAVGPEQVLRGADRLVFAGVVDAIRELVNTRGLVPATDQVFKLDSPRFRRRLFEAVVSATSPAAGRTVRDARFRDRYAGAVLAVARNGERVAGRIGDIRLEPGDLLLVEADPGFAERVGATRDFLLVSRLEDSTPRRHARAPLALGILLAMVALASFGVYDMLIAAMLAAGAMVLTRCCTITEARTSIDWSVLIVIAASLGIGVAMEQTGAATLAANGVLGLVGTHPWAVLIAIYALTMVVNEIISNNAAVALVFPIAQATAASIDANFMPFIIALMMAGSASFATPIGYQTHLMVYGPGGYRFTDFLRIGIPMNLVVGVVSVALTPLVFPFH